MTFRKLFNMKKEKILKSKRKRDKRDIPSTDLKEEISKAT